MLAVSGILSTLFMPAVQRSEFALALNQIANERGVDASVVLETVENAILAAYRKDHPGIVVEEFSAKLNQNTGEAKIFHNDKDVTPPGFGRIAAQTAKQVILQKIREKEKEAIITDYKVKMGTVVNGMVLRFAGPTVIVDIGKAEGVMPPSEQISFEKYHLNQRLAVYLSEVREGPRGDEIIVSRASNGLLEGLFRREVPEVASGAVEIKAIAREAGTRSKIAVFSSQPGIDPVGSCVGQKGVRVQAVIQELGGIEKIDIIQWQENTKEYIAQALSPAKNVRVELKEDEKTAFVYVAQEELSLAIGKEGQNVRLASKLTGYRIEIEPAEGETAEAPKKATSTPAEEAAVVAKEHQKEQAAVQDEIQRIEKEEDAETTSEEPASEEQLAEVTSELVEETKESSDEEAKATE